MESAVIDLPAPGTGQIIFGILVLRAWAVWLIALIDMLPSQFRGDTDKAIWVLAVLFVPLVGAVLYLIIGKRNKINYN